MSDDLNAVRARIERAHTEVGEICKRDGAGRWRMSIPARPDRDSDLVISAALDDAEKLLAEVERLREEVTFHNTVRLDVEKVLDKAHGTEEEDGAGAGLAADVDLLRVQRDDARGIAVALEQQVAEIEKYAYMRHSDEWVRRRICSVFEAAKREATS